MAQTRYAGDNPAKKVARLVHWKRVKEILGKRFSTGTHVVLLSPEAGDVSVLLGLGVHPTHIVGVDHDKRAVTLAKKRYSEVDCRYAEVTKVVKDLKKEGRSIASVYLDFCAPLRESTVGTAAEVSRMLSKGAVLSIAVKMGREKGEWADSVNEAKEKAGTGSAAFYLRADLLSKEYTKRKVPLSPVAFYKYESRGVGIIHQNGMLVCISRVDPDARRRSVRGLEYTTILADHTAIGPLASQLEANGEDSTLLLNIQQESVPPYKAHRTRGTYKGRKSSVVRHKR